MLVFYILPLYFGIASAALYNKKPREAKITRRFTWTRSISSNVLPKIHRWRRYRKMCRLFLQPRWS